MKTLYDLLNKEKFEWTNLSGEALNWVKNELISSIFLAHYDPKEEIVLASDASDYGLSAILSHKFKDGTEKPIAYASKKIPGKVVKRSIIDKEAMAIVIGFKKFLCASGTETRFSITAESNGMLCIPLQRNTI